MKTGKELAFPFVSHGGFHEHQQCDGGLTKREWFAGIIMAGLSGNAALEKMQRFSAPKKELNAMAEMSVAWADALLAELAKPE